MQLLTKKVSVEAIAILLILLNNPYSVGKIAVKAVRRSVFLIIWQCIFSAELTKTHSFRLFFDDFANWVYSMMKITPYRPRKKDLIIRL